MAAGQKVIRTNQSIVPFFGERMSFIRGLDPLGLQNTSESTFSLLLPGLNNVTDRIRYYSFYCWLLDEYSKRIGSTDPEKQRIFIRKAEYLMALCAQFYPGDHNGIPGNNYADNQVNNTELTTYSLDTGIANADGSTENTYWRYPWGAFSQYYLGSLKTLGIIIDRETDSHIYARTSSEKADFISGESLAIAFNENVPIACKELFFACLSSGTISEDQILELLPAFNLTIIPEGSREQALLTELLLQKDYPLKMEDEPSLLRKQTIFHLVDFAKSAPEQSRDRQFIFSAYDRKGHTGDGLDSCLLGWYFYQFNDFWQFANTAILHGLLNYLHDTEGPNWAPLHAFVASVEEQVIIILKEQGLVIDKDQAIRKLIDILDPNEYSFHTTASRSKGIEEVVYGLLLILSIFKNNLAELGLLKEYSENFDVAKDGEASHYFSSEFEAKLDLPLKDFIREYLFQKIIFRHQYVAFRKMRGRSQSTQKFIIEDFQIRYLGNFEAGFSGPRVSNLMSFLRDLNILDQQFKTTDYGEQILNQISPIND
jgi:hypothetical protein